MSSVDCLLKYHFEIRICTGCTEVGRSPLFIYYELLLVAMGLTPCKLTDSIKHKIHVDCNTIDK